MLVNLGTGAQNSQDWDRVLAGDFSRPPVTPDYKCVQAALALGDLAEPLGFDGIWFPEHHGTPYGMTPNPLQALTYFAGRTERVSLGTFVAVAPWWNPIRLATQIAYLDIVSGGRYTTIFLTPHGYHYVHMPIAGTVLDLRPLAPPMRDQSAQGACTGFAGRGGGALQGPDPALAWKATALAPLFRALPGAGAGTIGAPCGGPPLPPCLNDLTCVGPVGAQTCQACE